MSVHRLRRRVGGGGVPAELHAIALRDGDAHRAAAWSPLPAPWTLRVWCLPDVRAMLGQLHGGESLLRAFETLPHVEQREHYALAAVAYARGGVVVLRDVEPTAALAGCKWLTTAEAQQQPCTLVGALPHSHSAARSLSLGALPQLLSPRVAVTSPRRALWLSYLESLQPQPRAALEDRTLLASLVPLTTRSRDELRVALSTGALHFSEWWAAAAARGDATVVPSGVLEGCACSGGGGDGGGGGVHGVAVSLPPFVHAACTSGGTRAPGTSPGDELLARSPTHWLLRAVGPTLALTGAAAFGGALVAQRLVVPAARGRR